MDRSSRPLRFRAKTPEGVTRRIVELRRQRLTCAQISERVGRSRATVARIVAGAGLSRLRSLDPPELPPQRYEWDRPGELLHLDIKKLGRIAGVGHRITGDRSVRNEPGWEYLHVCIDDASRVAYAEILADDRKQTAKRFLERAVGWFRRRGVKVLRVMTDNGGCYISSVFALACRQLGVRHLFTRPRRPQTNGKAERLIQTLLCEWAYRFAYRSSKQRLHQLQPYLHFYNAHRAHTSLGHRTPISRLTMNNLLRLHN